MPRRTRSGFTGAVPLTFFAIPAAGAVTHGLSSAACSCALVHHPARSVGGTSMFDSTRLAERDHRKDEYRSVQILRPRVRDDAAAQRVRPSEAVEMGVVGNTAVAVVQARHRKVHANGGGRTREGDSAASRLLEDNINSGKGTTTRRRGREEAAPVSSEGWGGESMGTDFRASSSASDGEKNVGSLLALAAGIRPGKAAFLSELKAAANTKNWEHSLKLLGGWQEAGYDPHPEAYACAIRACGKAGKWEHSLALLDEMRSSGAEPGERCNVMALKACADAGLWEKALAILKEMRVSGVDRSESTFAVAMKACGDAGRWEETLALMDDMRRDGVPPMEMSYTIAMKACGSAGEWEQSLKLFHEMRDMGIASTEQCFTAAIKACAKADKAKEAMSLLLKMRATPGVTTSMADYRAVINACSRAEDWASALGLLEDARRERHKPTTADLRPILKACGKAEQHERALSLLEEMRSEGMNLRRTGEKLWWVFDTCRDKRVKDRAWMLMEVEETRERWRLRAERNAKKAAEAAAASEGGAADSRAN